MKYSFVLLALLSTASFASQAQGTPTEEVMDTHVEQSDSPTPYMQEYKEVSSLKQHNILEVDKVLLISVVGQGVAPMNTSSPAQAYALAKRAAVADAYRLIAEKVKGVRVDGKDLIQNMMVKRSSVRTSVEAMVRNANIVETTFKEGLCEVEMEIALSYSQFQH